VSVAQITASTSSRQQDKLKKEQTSMYHINNCYVTISITTITTAKKGVNAVKKLAQFNGH